MLPSKQLGQMIESSTFAGESRHKSDELTIIAPNLLVDKSTEVLQGETLVGSTCVCAFGTVLSADNI